MYVLPTGVFFVGECDIQSAKCTAREPGPITAVKLGPGRTQVNVCRSCLEQMVRDGQWEVRDARIDSQADILVQSANGRPVLVVECKFVPGQPGADLRLRATQIRRNLLAHRGIPPAPYFMVAYYPRSAYLWTSSDRSSIEAPPDREIDLATELGPSSAPDSGNEHLNAERLVADWLSRLIVQEGSNQEALPRWFTESGIARAARGGRVAGAAVAAA